MTDEELNARIAQMTDAVARLAGTTESKFEQMANTVARVAEAFTLGLQGLERSIQRLENSLEKGHLRTQAQIGELSTVMLHMMERQERHEQELEKLQKRQEDADQRFNILLEEIRFLIRQQHPPEKG